MSNGRSFKRQLAVAAVAVAGVLGLVGTAWSTLPTGSTSGADVLTATYSVNLVAELDATSGNLTQENLSCVVDAVPTIATFATNFGNLGTIKVKTTAKSWDVNMTTNNGGKMRDNQSVTCSQVPDVDGWGNQLSTTHEVCTGTPAFLKYDNSGTPTNVVLDVAIGVAKTGYALGNTAAPATLYPLASAVSSSGPTFIAPAKVSQAKVINSEVGSGSFAPISFATEIVNDKGSANWGDYEPGIYGQAETPATPPATSVWAAIGNDGFPVPKYNNEPNVEYFYINVGMDPSVYNKVGGNTNQRNYVETFNFSLVANF